MPRLTPLVWINVVGLTPRLLSCAPNLSALAERGCSGPIGGVLPAVTCSAQATALTGLVPSGHGIVGNGWLHRDTGEVRFWLQSNRLIQGEPVYVTARKLAYERELPFTAAKLFWWFNQGAAVDWSVTPKPYYGSDGSKVFAVHGDPEELAPSIVKRLGPFPFHAFWGPKAGLASSEWIAEASAIVLREMRPTFSMVYLPHLDYDLQRLGATHPSVAQRVAEVDRCAGLVIGAAREIGADVVAFSEYGIRDVSHVELPNRALREAGLLKVRDGPFGETIDTFRSDAIAVCDHQIAHVYLRDMRSLGRVVTLFERIPGVARVMGRDARMATGIEHPRAGDLVLLARGDTWFAYPYWLDDKRAPDFARTVDIHRKPGYDPLELFVDPKLTVPALRVGRRLLQKKLGMRYRFDVVPLDPTLAKGSHGLLPIDAADGPVLVADDPMATEQVRTLADLKSHALERLGLTHS
ncbi:MAG: alkaline phosphatase family protein [Planctomycetota bacterium]|nr:alkaline phosphatase family protein [Planctomycetota bacterium]